jgi:hypothetical protein
VYTSSDSSEASIRSSAAKYKPAWVVYPAAPSARPIPMSRRPTARISRAAPAAMSRSQNKAAASVKRTASSVPTVAPSP